MLLDDFERGPVLNDAGGDYRYEMTDGDHCDLACVLHRVQGMVVLSGYPSLLYDQWYPKWRRVERVALADGARKRTEVLWLNPSAATALHHGSLFPVTTGTSEVA